MTFEAALTQMKCGRRVQRRGRWSPQQSVLIQAINEYRPCFVMELEDGTATPGWAPSAEDCLATDWQVMV